jgi:C4-type Zn-finger protein
MIVDQKQRRQYYRLPYPEKAKPPLTTEDGVLYRIHEIAENSLVLEQNEKLPLKVDDQICGMVIFHNEGKENVKGKVLRLDERGAVIILSKGIKQRNVLQEQTYLSRNFPLFFRRGI